MTSPAAQQFIERVNDRSLVVGIIGLGYVGIPLALATLRQGFRVVGFDIDARRVDDINAGRSAIKHIPMEPIAQAVAADRFVATADFDRLGEPDALLIAVPTPLTRYREPDLSYVVRTVPVSSTATAEAVKLTENIFRAVNIALVNELKTVYSAMGIDIWEVIEAAKTKPFGFMPFYPGPGLGGHCVPIDPFYLTWKAREYDVATRFIELAGEINTRMPYLVVDRLATLLDIHGRKNLSDASILVLGLAYKKNVEDTRESPSLKLIELIEKRGARTAFHDPHVPLLPPTREHPTLAGRRSVPVDSASLAAFDAVLIATDHDDVDYAAIVAGSKLVVDTRNVCTRAGIRADNVFKA